MTKAHFSHSHAALYTVIFITLVIFTLWVSAPSPSRQRIETTQERFIRESQPGTPIVISSEDRKRMDEESQPGKAL